MSLYPDSATCEVCGRGTWVRGYWLCPACVTIAVQLGLDVEVTCCPSDEDRDKILEVVKERQRAESERRRDEEARPKGSP